MKGTPQVRAWVTLLALAAGVLVFQLLERSRDWTARSQAEPLGKELLTAETPEQATAIARELGTLDDAAIQPLVQGLVHDEPFISAAAAEEISRRLANWRQLPRKKSGAKVAALVRELAEECEAIPPEQQIAARRWAEAVLLWPLKGSGADAAAILADCEAILALPQPDEEFLAERLARLAQQQGNVPSEENSLEVETPSEPTPQESEDLPPIVSPHEALAQQSTANPTLDADPAESESLPPYPREPRGIYIPRARPIEDAAPTREPDPLPPDDSTLLPPVKASAVVEDLTSLVEIDVMRDLQSEDPTTVTAAEDELTRRGYTASHLSLARQLTSPDPRVRLKLVESLSKARGIDPRPWLLRLSEDGNETVRTAALSILRTSQDPELLQMLR